MSALAISFVLGLAAASGDVFGGLLLVRTNWEKRYLRYFIALGAGFMLAIAFLDMIPESFHLTTEWTPVLVFGGYCIIHLIEHTITPHFHFGEETHSDAFLSARTGYSVVGGLAVHSLFDGVAIASGFLLSWWLGWLIFVAIFLHKIPEGFTVASVALASGRSRGNALFSAGIVASATIAGVLVVNLLPRLVLVGLPLSAGVAIYVAATDLLPEVNREPGIRMALIFFLGVGIFILCEFFARGALGSGFR